MKILFTGFTSRTTGSEQIRYDYLSNVFVLKRALELAGHEVDCRPVSLQTDPCIEEDYDCAVVGTAACHSMSSRFKLGALWTMHKFGTRAGIFPSDGMNLYMFPTSLRTCLTGEHGARTPYEYFLSGQFDKTNVVDAEFAADMGPLFTSILERLPWSESNPHCDWRVLVPTHSWGNPEVYRRYYGTKDLMTWDPTNVAIPMQFPAGTLAPDGRLVAVHTALANERKRAWIVSSLQNQAVWIKRQNCKWPVVVIGNKRTASRGEGADYIPELQLIEEYYTKHWGHLAFGYPLADGGWWRMRYVHAALAGIVTCTDETNARRMPPDFQHSRIMLERFSDEKLAEVALNQHLQLMDSAWPADRAIETVDAFVRGLV